MKTTLWLILFMFTISISATFAQGSTQQTKATQTKHSVQQFDPKRDADKDIKNAIKEAQKLNKKILLDVGGLWCPWCRMLDKFFEDNADAYSALYDNYVVVKVNYSEENKNEKVLSRYPKVKGYPHIFILDKTGKLIHSQDTAELELGKGYDKEKILAFLNKYK